MAPPFVVCSSCAWFEPCGGITENGQLELSGCFTACHEPGRCEKDTWVCPCRGDVFRRRLREVGGLFGRRWKPLSGPSVPLPLHVPLIRHGNKRTVPFSAELVGVSIKELLPRVTESSYFPVVDTAEKLRSYFGLANDTKVLVVSVAKDAVLEPYWSYRTVNDTAQRLAALGITAMTVPNFSFFRDAPRTHTLYNRKRLMIVAEELSAVGIAVIPHLNAITHNDWRFWYEMLDDQRFVSTVAIEMQTGYRDPQRATAAINALRSIQDQLGRALHLVVVGGARHAGVLAEHFNTLTFADSHAFTCTFRRRELRAVGSRLRKVYAPRDPDELLPRNVAAQRRWLTNRVEHGRQQRLALAG